MRISFYGVRFFFTHVLPRDWATLKLLAARREQKLPAVLSVEEVHRLLAAVQIPHYRTILTLIYACGLRLQEARFLQIGDIDRARGVLHVHRGKGAKDRLVPLPRTVLAMLREHWRSHRHRVLLFPGIGRGAMDDAPLRALCRRADVGLQHPAGALNL